MAARALISRNRRLAILAVLSLGIAASAQELSEKTVIPVELRSALRAGPEPFARAGASSGLAMGIIRTETWDSTEKPGIATKNIEGRTTVGDVFALFRALHPDYDAAITGGLLKFRPVAPSVCDAGLAAPLPPITLSGTDVEIVSRLLDLPSL